MDVHSIVIVIYIVVKIPLILDDTYMCEGLNPGPSGYIPLSYLVFFNWIILSDPHVYHSDHFKQQFSCRFAALALRATVNSKVQDL